MENMILPTTVFFRQPQKSQSQIRPCQIEIIFVEYLSISLKNRRQIVAFSADPIATECVAKQVVLN